MGDRRLFIVGIVTIVLFAAALLVFNHDSNAKYNFFKDNRGLFEAAKDEIYSFASEHRYHKYTFHLKGIIADDEFHMDLNESLDNYLNGLLELQPNLFDFARYDNRHGEHLIMFVYDWESVRVDTYHIVYCESYDALVEYYAKGNIEIRTVKLDDSWYGIEIR